MNKLITLNLVLLTGLIACQNVSALSFTFSATQELAIIDAEQEVDNLSIFCDEGEIIIANSPIEEDDQRISTALACNEVKKLSLDFANSNNDLNIFLGQIEVSDFSSLEGTTIRTGKGNDDIFGSPLADTVYAGAGDDDFHGYGGNDQFYGQGGDDDAWGGNGNDFLSGGPGNDYLRGENGLDRLLGGKGLDKLLGGRGLDKLISDLLDLFSKQ